MPSGWRRTWKQYQADEEARRIDEIRRTSPGWLWWCPTCKTYPPRYEWRLVREDGYHRTCKTQMVKRPDAEVNEEGK